MISILVVNINGLQYTKPLVDDLFRQTETHRLTIVDQGSTEEGTEDYLRSLEPHTTIIRNTHNVDLSRVWNAFHAASSPDDILCLLNNDVRVYPNFVANTHDVFRIERRVGIVVHSTNHPIFSTPTSLCYRVMRRRFVQGWDIAIRHAAYTPIPDHIRVFGGDDWLFVRAYESGWRAAVVLSSPIMHHNGASRHYCPYTRSDEAQRCLDDGSLPNLPHTNPYSQRWPTWCPL